MCFDKAQFIYNIYISENKYYVEGKSCSYDQLKGNIQQRVSEFNILDKPFATARLYVDASAKMKLLYKLYKVLRELQLYKIGFACLPTDDISKLQYHYSALPPKLPPLEKDGAKLQEIDDIKDRVYNTTTTQNTAII